MPIASASLLTAAIVAYRLLTPNAMSVSTLYRPTLSVEHYLKRAAQYHNILFYSTGLLGLRGVIALWLGAGVVAFLLRSRKMGFGLSFWIVTILPVCLIPPRAGYVLYVPSIGLALYTSMLIVFLRRVVLTPMFKRVSTLLVSNDKTYRMPSQVSALVVLMTVLSFVHSRARAAAVSDVLRPQQQVLREFIEKLRYLHPTIKPNSRILPLNAPFAGDNWTLLFSMRLLYDDPSILVDHPGLRSHEDVYDYVFDCSLGRGLTETSIKSTSCHTPDVSTLSSSIDDTDPDICWHGIWNSDPLLIAKNGGVTWSGEEGAWARITFIGSTLTYVYTKAPNRGMAKVTIDGERNYVVNLYDYDTVGQASTTFSNFQRGRHTAVIGVLGKRDRRATDAIIDIDAFLVN